MIKFISLLFYYSIKSLSIDLMMEDIKRDFIFLLLWTNPRSKNSKTIHLQELIFAEENGMNQSNMFIKPGVIFNV